MKLLKVTIIPVLALLLISASSQEPRFERAKVLSFTKVEGWTKWHTPEKGKIWKIENIWSGLHANAAHYYIQVNKAKTRHTYNEEFRSFWISDQDSIRLKRDGGEFDFAVSILEYAVE
ncbi:MAG: hypothetical protein N4A46_14250 [Schleiferiaceae bacterium]|jgi:hypothetical protein|nr:hypothetical protein [Schleiferiaceae bacterium]